MKKQTMWLIGAVTALVVGGGIFGYVKTSRDSLTTQVDALYETMNIQSITKNSVRIVVGTVTKQEVKDVGSGDEATVMTFSTFTPTEHLKGASVPTFLIEQEGGKSPTQDTTVVVEENLMLEQGKRYLLFLRQETSGNYGILGGPQGKYTLNGNDIVEQDTAKRVTGLASKVDLQKMKEMVQKYL